MCVFQVISSKQVHAPVLTVVVKLPHGLRRCVQPALSQGEGDGHVA